VFNQDKSVIRQRILNLLKNQKEEDRIRKSGLIKDKLFADPGFRRSKTVLFYSSFNGEVDTFEIMKQSQKDGKQIALPAIPLKEKRIVPCLVDNLGDDLETGPYGIKQPRLDRAKTLTLDALDLAIVPGVAFDRDNHRLGRGAGYYDRFLASLPKGTLSIGLAFGFQLLDVLPRHEHDVPVSRIITDQ